MVTARCIGFNLLREDKLDLFFPKVEIFADSCRTDQEGWSKLWLFLGFSFVALVPHHFLDLGLRQAFCPRRFHRGPAFIGPPATTPTRADHSP